MSGVTTTLAFSYACTITVTVSRRGWGFAHGMSFGYVCLPHPELPKLYDPCVRQGNNILLFHVAVGRPRRGGIWCGSMLEGCLRRSESSRREISEASENITVHALHTHHNIVLLCQMPQGASSNNFVPLARLRLLEVPSRLPVGFVSYSKEPT